MADQRHYRKGKLIKEPRNWPDLEIDMNWLDRKEGANINITSMNFVGKTAKDIRTRYLDGLTGGLGVFEGDPYRIEVGPEGSPAFTFKGYLDYTDDTTFIGTNEVQVSLKKEQGEDWLNDVADSFSMRYLRSIGVISASDEVKIPYVINYVPDGQELILLSIATFMMAKELIESTKRIAESVVTLIEAFTPGVGIGFGAVVVTNLGLIIGSTIRLIINLAYSIAIIIFIKNLIEDILEQLLPKKRNHLGVPIRTLFAKSCQYLKLQLSSTLLDARFNHVVLPEKSYKGEDAPSGVVETGMPQNDGPIDTFGDLIRVFKNYYNAEFRIINGVFHFERVDFWDNLNSKFRIPNTFTDQEKLLDNQKFNADEIFANYVIHYRADNNDMNTLDNQEGRYFQAIITPNTVNNQKLVNIKNLAGPDIPFALGLEKRELNTIEKAAKTLGKAIDKLTGILGGGTNFASKIEERKGSLLMTDHRVAIPKIIVMDGANLANNQRTLLSGRRLWDDLHFVNSFAEYQGHHNQWIRFQGAKIDFCLEDFVSLAENNHVKTVDGKSAIIETLKWKVAENTAIIDYRVKQKYTNNLKLTIV